MVDMVLGLWVWCRIVYRPNACHLVWQVNEPLKSTINGYKQMSAEQCGSALSADIYFLYPVSDLYAAYRK